MDLFSIIPIAAAAAANMVLGAIWYHPRLFGSAWMRSTNISPDLVERGKRRVHLYNLFALCASIAFAATVLFLQRAAGIATPLDAMRFAALLWIGCLLPVTLGQLLWDQKPTKLFLVNAGFWLLASEVTSLIVFY